MWEDGPVFELGTLCQHFLSLCDEGERGGRGGRTVSRISFFLMVVCLCSLDGSSRITRRYKISCSRSVKYLNPKREVGSSGFLGKNARKARPTRIVKIPSICDGMSVSERSLSCGCGQKGTWTYDKEPLPTC